MTGNERRARLDRRLSVIKRGVIGVSVAGFAAFAGLAGIRGDGRPGTTSARASTSRTQARPNDQSSYFDGGGFGLSQGGSSSSPPMAQSGGS